MKLATIRNGELISRAPNLPKRAKINISVWCKLPGEPTVRRTDLTPDGFFNVRAFLGDEENINQYINEFLVGHGIQDGQDCEAYGLDVYRWR